MITAEEAKQRSIRNKKTADEDDIRIVGNIIESAIRQGRTNTAVKTKGIKNLVGLREHLKKLGYITAISGSWPGLTPTSMAPESFVELLTICW